MWYDKVCAGIGEACRILTAALDGLQYWFENICPHMADRQKLKRKGLRKWNSLSYKLKM